MAWAASGLQLCLSTWRIQWGILAQPGPASPQLSCVSGRWHRTASGCFMCLVFQISLACATSLQPALAEPSPARIFERERL